MTDLITTEALAELEAQHTELFACDDPRCDKCECTIEKFLNAFPSLAATIRALMAERDEAKASESRAWDQYAQKVAELAKAQARIAELETYFGPCGCAIGTCEQYPETDLVHYGRICCAARLLSPTPKKGPTP